MEGADDRVINHTGQFSNTVFRVTVVRPVAKLTGLLLLLMMKAAVNAIHRQMHNGGMSLKKLNASGQALDKEEVEPERFKDVKRQLRKDGVEFSPQVDPLDPTKMHLYFKAKDHATVKHALEKVVEQGMKSRQRKPLKTSKERSKQRTKQSKQAKNVIHFSKKKTLSKERLKR